jgi:hypothetical protein
VRSTSCPAAGNDNLLPRLAHTRAHIVINKIIISPLAGVLALGSLIVLIPFRAVLYNMYNLFALRAPPNSFPFLYFRAREDSTSIIIISDQFFYLIFLEFDEPRSKVYTRVYFFLFSAGARIYFAAQALYY